MSSGEYVSVMRAMYDDEDNGNVGKEVRMWCVRGCVDVVCWMIRSGEGIELNRITGVLREMLYECGVCGELLDKVCECGIDECMDVLCSVVKIVSPILYYKNVVVGDGICVLGDGDMVEKWFVEDGRYVCYVYGVDVFGDVCLDVLCGEVRDMLYGCVCDWERGVECVDVLYRKMCGVRRYCYDGLLCMLGAATPILNICMNGYVDDECMGMMGCDGLFGVLYKMFVVVCGGEGMYESMCVLYRKVCGWKKCVGMRVEDGMVKFSSVGVSKCVYDDLCSMRGVINKYMCGMMCYDEYVESMGDCMCGVLERCGGMSQLLLMLMLAACRSGCVSIDDENVCLYSEMGSKIDMRVECVIVCVVRILCGMCVCDECGVVNRFVGWLLCDMGNLYSVCGRECRLGARVVSLDGGDGWNGYVAKSVLNVIVGMVDEEVFKELVCECDSSVGEMYKSMG